MRRYFRPQHVELLPQLANGSSLPAFLPLRQVGPRPSFSCRWTAPRASLATKRFNSNHFFQLAEQPLEISASVDEAIYAMATR